MVIARLIKGTGRLTSHLGATGSLNEQENGKDKIKTKIIALRLERISGRTDKLEFSFFIIASSNSLFIIFG
jgi:hypothetical protein